jgi:hypothetical protein
VEAPVGTAFEIYAGENNNNKFAARNSNWSGKVFDPEDAAVPDAVWSLFPARVQETQGCGRTKHNDFRC